MLSYGVLHPIDLVPSVPDTIQTLLIAGSSGQAMDWASTLAQIVELSGVSTAGALLNFWVNLTSTRAAAPSSGTSTGTLGGTTGVAIPVQGRRVMQIPGGSTGFSVAALSSGYVQAVLWRK